MRRGGLAARSRALPAVRLGALSAATRNLTYTLLVGPPPDPRKLAWFSWYSRLLAARLANVPLARGTTYYFAAAGSGGSDSNTATQASPFATLAKAQLVLTAASATGGNVCLMFNKGDTWREDQLLSVPSNCSVGSYGSGSRPVFTRFVYQYSSGWADDGSGNAFSRTETHDIAWLKYGDGVNDLTVPLTRSDSAANCRLTDNSFFMDLAGTKLYVRLASNASPNSATLEACVGTAISDYHVNLNGDNIRFQGIKTVGYGMRPNSPAAGYTDSVYGIAARPTTATAEIVVEDCEVYYSGYHALAALSSTGGFCTFKGNTAGLCRMRSDQGCIVGVAFADNGGMESIWENHTTHSGSLFEAGLNTARAAYSLYSHVGSGGAHSLVVVRGHTITAGSFSTRYGSWFDGVVDPAGVLTAARCFLVDEVVDFSAQVQSQPFSVAPNFGGMVTINSSYKIHENVNSAIGAAGLGWSINTIYQGDSTTGYTSLFNSVANGGTFLHCHLRHDGYGALFTAGSDAAAWANVVLTNCLLEPANPGGVQSEDSANLSNSAGNATYCGWYSRDPVPAGAQTSPAGTAGVGAIGDAHKTMIAAPLAVGAAYPTDCPLANAGTSAAGVEYDYNRATRSTYDLGPLVASGTMTNPANLTSLLLWLPDNAWYKDTGCSAGQEAAVLDTVQGWKQGGGSLGTNWTQSTGANAPTRQSAGLQCDVTHYLTGSTGALGVATIYAIMTRASGQVGRVFGSNPGGSTTAVAEFYSDNNAYWINDGAAVFGAAVSPTGQFLARFTRLANGLAVRATAANAVTSAQTGTGNTTFNTIGSRVGFDGTNSASRLRDVWLFGADMRGTSTERSLLQWVQVNRSLVMI